MFGLSEENEFYSIRERSVEQWLSEMEEHEDIAVRCGVRATRECIETLKKQIADLEEKNKLKDTYLKKMKDKYK